MPKLPNLTEVPNLQPRSVSQGSPNDVPDAAMANPPVVSETDASLDAGPKVEGHGHVFCPAKYRTTRGHVRVDN